MHSTAIDPEQLAGVCGAALDALCRPVIICDREEILFANAAAARMLRAESGEALVGLPVDKLVHEDMHTPEAIRRNLLLETQQQLLALPTKVYACDGSVVTAITDARPVELEGRVVVVYSISPCAEHISSQRCRPKPEKETRSDILAGALEVLPDAVLIYDDAMILFVNAAGRRLLAATSASDLEGQPLDLVVHPDARDAGLERRQLLLVSDRPMRDLPLKALALDGEVLHLSADAHPLQVHGMNAGMLVATAESL